MDLLRLRIPTKLHRFTVIELLVTISIIMMLGAMLFPMFGHGRRSGKYGRWLGFKNNIRADDSMKLFYTFENESAEVEENLALGDSMNSEEKVETYTGTYSGGTFITGRYRGKSCMFYDGSNWEWVLVNDYRGVSGTDARTVSAWIRSQGANSGSRAPIIGWGRNLAGRGWLVMVDNMQPGGPPKDGVQSGALTGGKISPPGTPASPLGGTLALRVGGNNEVKGTTNIGDGAWHHIAITWEDDGTPKKGDAILYVDGQIESVTTSGGDADVNTQTEGTGSSAMYIGYYSLNQYIGNICEIAVFDRALKEREVREIYQMGKP